MYIEEKRKGVAKRSQKGGRGGGWGGWP